MASAWRRVMVYLGLVDDDEYEEYEPVYEDQPVRAGRPAAPPSPYEPEASGVRTLSREESGVTLQPRPAVVRPITPVEAIATRLAGAAATTAAAPCILAASSSP